MNNNTEIRHLTDLLRDTFSGDPWHGPSVQETLKKVSPAELKNRSGKGHSIQELIFHMLAWRKFVIRRLTNKEEIGQIDTENWNVPVTPEPASPEWLAEKMNETQKNLLEILSGWSDPQLDETVQGKPYTYRKMINGLIHHDLYHLGQIGLLRK